MTDRPRLAALLVAARREWLPLLVLALAAASAALFLLVAAEVAEGDTHALDRRILLALRAPGDPADPLGPGWLEEVMRDLTGLGGYGVLTLLTAAVIGLLALWRRWRDVVLVAASVAGSVALNTALKHGFDRPRPDLVPHGVHVTTPSFPSGHSMAAAAVYLTLAAVVARALPRRRLRIYVLAWALAVAGIVGLTRVYLGVHWPSDVLAGWAGGASWALVTWALAEWGANRRAPASE